MKTSFLLKTLFATLLMSGSALAMAAPPPAGTIVDTGHSGVIKVSGSVTPKACAISFGSGPTHTVEYGDIQADWGLNPTKMLKIGVQKNFLTSVTCKGGAVPIVLSFTDDRTGTAPSIASRDLPAGSFPFGLGEVNGENIGAFTLHMSSHEVGYKTNISDPITRSVPTTSTNSGGTWTKYTSGELYLQGNAGFYVGVASANSAEVGPVPAQYIQGTIAINSWLNEEKFFPHGAKIDLNGQVTVKISYVA